MRSFRQLRNDAGLKQQGMADSLGVDRTTVTKWESGGAYPRAQALPEIATMLKCTEGEVIAAITAARRAEADTA